MEVKCEYKRGDSGLYQCIVKDAEITEPRQVIKAFKGKHLSGKTSADVEDLFFFIEPKVQYVPQDLHKHFPNLTDLSFLKCEIKEISNQDLRGLKKLETLWVGSCKLTSLPDDLLTNMPKLHSASFEYNQIESASSNLLKPLVGRIGVSVDLRGNKNINASYDSVDIDDSTHESLEELMKAIDEKCRKPITSNNIAAEDFNEGIKKLWTSGCFSDFKIISGGKQFNVHRTILMLRSEVFAEIIAGHKDATEIKINDFTPIAVESLLDFIYTNKIIHEDNAKENFIIARKFKIQKMKSAFEGIISNNLNDINAYDMFLFAHQNAADELKKKAFEMISKMRPDPLPVQLMEDPAKLKKLFEKRLEIVKLLEEEKKLLR